MTEEKKVILMTKAALCRQQEQDRDLRITKFYKKDYLLFHGILAWFSVTAAFCILVLLWLMYAIESDSSTYLLNRITSLVVIGVLVYVAVCIGYVAFAVSHYQKRYDHAAETSAQYREYLEQIQKL